MRIGRVVTSYGETTYVQERSENEFVRLSGDPFDGFTNTGEPVKPDRFLPPIPPRVIMCIGKNYAAHAAEMESEAPVYPVMFMKNLSAATGHMEPVRIPAVCGDEVDFEGELAAIIGREAKDVPEGRALDHVLGYTCGNDVSARIWQKDKGGSQWNRGKSFDTFAPLGPIIVTADELGDPQDLTLETRVNGEVMQTGRTDQMIFPVARLIAFLSQDTTLLPGTVIMTGTPSGVGWARDPRRTLQPGDEVRVSISKIGTLVNRLVTA